MKKLIGLLVLLCLACGVQAQNLTFSSYGKKRHLTLVIKGIPGIDSLEVKKGDTIAIGKPFNNLAKFSFIISDYLRSNNKLDAGKSFNKYIVTKIIYNYKYTIQPSYSIDANAGYFDFVEIVNVGKAIRTGELVSANGIKLINK